MSRRGDLEAITYTLKKSIGKCYLQALRAKKAYLEGRLKLPLKVRPTYSFNVVPSYTYP